MQHLRLNVVEGVHRRTGGRKGEGGGGEIGKGMRKEKGAEAPFPLRTKRFSVELKRFFVRRQQFFSDEHVEVVDDHGTTFTFGEEFGPFLQHEALPNQGCCKLIIEGIAHLTVHTSKEQFNLRPALSVCLLYTSDAADE